MDSGSNSHRQRLGELGRNLSGEQAVMRGTRNVSVLLRYQLRTGTILGLDSHWMPTRLENSKPSMEAVRLMLKAWRKVKRLMEC